MNSLAVGVLDGIGLALFIPLLQSTESVGSGNSSDMGNLQVLVNWLEGMGVELTMNTVLAIMAVLFVFKGVLKYWEKYYNVLTRNVFLRKIRYQLIDGISKMRYIHYTTSDSGKIQNTVTTEVQRVMVSYNQYFITAQGLVMVLVYISLAFLANARFAILVVVAALLLNFIFKYFYRITKRWSKNITREGHHLQGFLIQSVHYFKYLKATNGFGNYSKKIKEKIDNIEHANLQMGKVGAILVGSREALTILIVIVVIVIQVNLFGGAISSLILSLLFFYRSLGNLMTIQTSWNAFLAASGALDNVQSYVKELYQEKEQPGTIKMNEKLKSIKLKDLSFSYGHTLTLNSIDLEIKALETVAIIGESGSGKTTLVNLLAGIMDNYQGSLDINGRPLADLKKGSWRSRIGYITQEPVIFNDTIANNISFWDDRPKVEIENKLNKAMRKAAIYEFVQTLALKEQSPLGNNGVMVSGGQKQRISIARELYKDVELLIMDEATSALDTETEKMIQSNIDLLKGKYTMIIIAHRLSTIKNADKIVLLDNGTIQAIGSFTELMQTSERFQKMVDIQNF
ncbi:MAG: ABC transporter ATP-binding protein [Bacteroidia bacterium]